MRNQIRSSLITMHLLDDVFNWRWSLHPPLTLFYLRYACIQYVMSILICRCGDNIAMYNIALAQVACVDVAIASGFCRYREKTFHYLVSVSWTAVAAKRKIQKLHFFLFCMTGFGDRVVKVLGKQFAEIFQKRTTRWCVRVYTVIVYIRCVMCIFTTSQQRRRFTLVYGSQILTKYFKNTSLDECFVLRWADRW